jgi:hypothetical protein
MGAEVIRGRMCLVCGAPLGRGERCNPQCREQVRQELPYLLLLIPPVSVCFGLVIATGVALFAGGDL